MNKEFIPYEQALELKELDYDKPCLASWNFYTRELNYNGQPSIFSSEDVIQLPTFSQAFRWFRDKHNIQSCIKFTYAEHSFEIHFEKLANGETPSVMVRHFVDSWLGLNLGLFKTYEEAELECLKKLIEIVKNK
jgi:hypothetical protein